MLDIPRKGQTTARKSVAYNEKLHFALPELQVGHTNCLYPNYCD